VKTLKTMAIAAFAAVLTISAPAFAQHNHGPAQVPATSGHAGHEAMKMDGMGPATKAFAEANMKMHKDMTIVFSGNPDIDFARGMLPHHQGAINIAEIVLKYGKDASVKKLANEIITAQRKEIAQMMAWLAKNSTLSAGSDAVEVTKAYTEINAKMHKDMTMTFTDKADVDFMKGMVPHHEGAVDMAKVLLKFGKDAELRKLADDVVRTQNEEITMMQDWLKKNGA
jgi:uncharacterized protein (DUF305 family)